MRVAVVIVEVHRYLAERIAPKDNAERGSFFQLLAVLKVLEQGANTLFHEAVFKPKTVNLFQDTTSKQVRYKRCHVFQTNV